MLHQVAEHPPNTPRLGGRGPACRWFDEPVWLEPLPAVANHRVGGGVGVGALSELASQELGGVAGEWLAKALTMLNHRLSSVGIQNSFERSSRRNLLF
jgi:hypothetical protein